MPLPTPGSPLPPFSAQAAVSGRAVAPDAFRGRRAVLVVHGPKSADAAKDVSKALRARHPPSEVFSASVVDLRSFGGVWRRVAEAQVKSTYEKLAAKVRESGGDPAEWVAICPDWDGSVAAALGVEQPDSAPAAIVVGADGKVLGCAEGKDLAARTMELLGQA